MFRVMLNGSQRYAKIHFKVKKRKNLQVHSQNNVWGGGGYTVSASHSVNPKAWKTHPSQSVAVHFHRPLPPKIPLICPSSLAYDQWAGLFNIQMVHVVLFLVLPVYLTCTGHGVRSCSTSFCLKLQTLIQSQHRIHQSQGRLFQPTKACRYRYRSLLAVVKMARLWVKFDQALWQISS